MKIICVVSMLSKNTIIQYYYECLIQHDSNDNTGTSCLKECLIQHVSNANCGSSCLNKVRVVVLSRAEPIDVEKLISQGSLNSVQTYSTYS